MSGVVRVVLSSRRILSPNNNRSIEICVLESGPLPNRIDLSLIRNTPVEIARENVNFARENVDFTPYIPLCIYIQQPQPQPQQQQQQQQPQPQPQQLK